MDVAHFANLTRGLLCPHFLGGERMIGATRIQSTHCERKDWPGVLRGLGPTFWVAAIHYPVIVHDFSEKEREPRALWQGLSWVRYVAHRTFWGRPVDLGIRKSNNPLLWTPRFVAVKEYSRRGMMVSQYWERQYQKLPNNLVKEVEYFRKYLRVTPETISIQGCWGIDA